MAQVPAVLYQSSDCTMDHTPVGAVSMGDVVVLGTTLVTIAERDIAAGVKGAVSLEGIYEVPKVTGSISACAKLYWDADADPLGGTAGSGAVTTNSALGPFAGWADADGAESSDETVTMLLRSAESPTSVSRDDLGQDDAKVYRLPLQNFRVTGTGALLGATAGTPSGAFGITYGTFGTNAPKIVGEAASGNTKTDKMRVQFTLPAEYVDGETVTVRVSAIEAVGAATVSTTVDVEAFEVAAEAGLGGSPTDLCATAAQDVTDAVGDKDFTITATGLVAGDELDIQITGVTTDTGGTVGTILTIYSVALLLDVKG